MHLWKYAGSRERRRWSTVWWGHAEIVKHMTLWYMFLRLSPGQNTGQEEDLSEGHMLNGFSIKYCWSQAPAIRSFNLLKSPKLAQPIKPCVCSLLAKLRLGWIANIGKETKTMWSQKAKVFSLLSWQCFFCPPFPNYSLVRPTWGILMPSGACAPSDGPPWNQPCFWLGPWGRPEPEPDPHHPSSPPPPLSPYQLPSLATPVSPGALRLSPRRLWRGAAAAAGSSRRRCWDTPTSCCAAQSSSTGGAGRHQCQSILGSLTSRQLWSFQGLGEKRVGLEALEECDIHCVRREERILTGLQSQT